MLRMHCLLGPTCDTAAVLVRASRLGRLFRRTWLSNHRDVGKLSPMNTSRRQHRRFKETKSQGHKRNDNNMVLRGQEDESKSTPRGHRVTQTVGGVGSCLDCHHCACACAGGKEGQRLQVVSLLLEGERFRVQVDKGWASREGPGTLVQ